MPYLGKEPARVPVTAADIPDDSITAAKIVDGVITVDDIGPNAVGNSEMRDDAVGVAELSATGTASSSTFLRGDNSWATAGSTSASDLTSGTLPDGRFPSTLPSISGANLTNLPSQTANDFTNADHTKLDGIETNATADQTNAEIRAAVEAATDSNVFTDADHTKLNGVAASANNYVHPNHSGEVTSTADGATVIANNAVTNAKMADDAIGIAELSATGTPSSTTYLRGDNSWAAVSSGATGGGTDQVFVQNSQTITTDYTIPSGKSASCTGPITMNSGVDITLSAGSRWVIL